MDNPWDDLSDERANEVMRELVSTAENIVRPLLDKARREATTEEERRLAISKIALSLCVALAVIGQAHYQQKAGSKVFGDLVGSLVTEAMETLVDAMKEANDNEPAETEGTAWSRRRTG